MASFFLAVGAFIHKYVWFHSSLSDDAMIGKEPCFCISSFCFCSQEILFLLSCVWFTPFILAVTSEPYTEAKLETRPKARQYERSATISALQSTKGAFSKFKSNSYRLAALL